MSLSKPIFFTHLKTLARTTHHLHPFPPPSFLRFLSFATPEEAAAERRRRKRSLRMEPPSNSLRHHNQPQRRPQTPIQTQTQNPNAPKLPDSVSVLTSNRLNLHNKILTLIRDNDLEEAALFTRHSIYSNCRPTIFTCNAVMAALLRQSKYSDMLSLHRFITQAGVSPNVVTHNLIINAYCDVRKTDTAVEHYRQLINNAPFNPSPTTYRILVKGLVDNGKVDEGLKLKDEMMEKGLAPDPAVYNYVMLGLVKKGDSDAVLALYDELKGKLGGFVTDGIVYGGLMKAYFLKGMEKEAMECYEEAVGGKVRMSAVAYNSVLDALCKNGKFDEGLRLFERVMGEHDPPRRLAVNLGTFNVMVDGFCGQGRFKEAIEVFRGMGEKRCVPDTLSFNNLIEHLCGNDMVAEGEEVYREMGEKGFNPDEFTYVLLIDACFAENRADDAAGYFGKMVEAGLRPNLVVFNKVIDGLVKSGKIDEAKEIFDQMVEKLKPEVGNYESMLRTLCEAGKLDVVLKLVGDMLLDDNLGLSEEMKEVVVGALSKEGREEDLAKVIEEKEREKAEALAKAAEEAAAKAAADAAAKEAAASPINLRGTSLGSFSLGKLSFGKEEATEEAPAEVGAVEEAQANAEVVEEASANAEVVEEASANAEVVEEAVNVDELGEEAKAGDSATIN